MKKDYIQPQMEVTPIVMNTFLDTLSTDESDDLKLGANERLWDDFDDEGLWQ